MNKKMTEVPAHHNFYKNTILSVLSVSKATYLVLNVIVLHILKKENDFTGLK